MTGSGAGEAGVPIAPGGARRVNRRTVLTAGLAGAASLAGGVAWGVHQPTFPTLAHTYRGVRPGRVLVAYDSRFGTTAEVADTVARVVAEDGPAADVCPLERVLDLRGYSGVVVGAPIHADALKPEAVEFLGRYAPALGRIPVALFATSMSFALDPDRARQTVLKTDRLRAAAAASGLRPVSLQPFAGALDYGRMSAVNGMGYRLFAADDRSGDYRDWVVIRAWATSLRTRLVA